MPCYNYKCNCGREFEKIISKPNPDIPQECPDCGELAKFYMPLGCRSSVKFFFNYLAPDS